MFVARAGLKTRNFREGQSGLTALLAPKRKKKNDDYGFICWVPFMFGPCIGGLIGLVVLLGGTAMCATGYYARHFASTFSDNGTHVIRSVDSSKEFHMYNMTFLGPVIMGCGCFVIVIACVVVCEQRDKDVRMKIAEAQKKKDQRKTKKSTFYDSVVERLKKSDILNTGHKDKEKVAIINEIADKKKDSRKSSSKIFTLVPCIVQSEDEMDSKSTRKYTHIGEALRNIPMDIFTINVDKDGNSMLPIKVVDATSQIKEYKSSENTTKRFPIKKCPSAACIQELVKVEETKLNQLFPDRYTWLRRAKTDLDLLKHLDKNSLEPLNISASASKESLNVIETGEFEVPNNDPVKYISGDQSRENQGKSTSDENCSTTGSVLTVSSYDSDVIESTQQRNCDSDNREVCDNENRTNDRLFDVRNKESAKASSNVILCEASVHKEEGLYHTEPLLNQITPISNNQILQNNETSSLSKDLNNSLSNKDHNLKVDNHKVLALTSNMARANAASMDSFKRHLLVKEKALDIFDSSEDLAVEKQPLTNLSVNTSAAIDKNKPSSNASGGDIDDESTLYNIEYTV